MVWKCFATQGSTLIVRIRSNRMPRCLVIDIFWSIQKSVLNKATFTRLRFHSKLFHHPGWGSRARGTPMKKRSINRNIWAFFRGVEPSHWTSDRIVKPLLRKIYIADELFLLSAGQNNQFLFYITNEHQKFKNFFERGVRWRPTLQLQICRSIVVKRRGSSAKLQYREKKTW